MKEEASKHCPPGLPPFPHTHPAPLATHTYHLSEQAEWQQGGPVEPASSRGEAASSDPYSPREPTSSIWP